MEPYLKCIKCLREYSLQKEILSCPNHSPYYGYLTIMYPGSTFTPTKDKSIWKQYRQLLPINTYSMDFNEQKTPLLQISRFGQEYGLKNLFVKDESKNPTGSFKDRENLIAINKAVEWNINEVFVVSSGNAAVSTSAYAQRAGITCKCYVSDHLSVGKRLLIGMYGGILIEQKGSYEEIYRRAIDENYSGWNCTPGINPLKEEGVKTIGFEIWEEMGVPDIIVVPAGNGTLLFGIYKAFKELQHFGIIEKLPQMIGVQVQGAAPLKLSFEQGVDYREAKHIPDSFAEGILAQESYSSPKVMLALEDTAGKIIEVTDSEMRKALKNIIRLESLIPEPTSAAVYAGVQKLTGSSDQTIVLVQSAGGQKNLKEITELFLDVNDDSY